MSTILSEKKTLSPWAKGGIGLGAGALLLVLVGLLFPTAVAFFPLVSLWCSCVLFYGALWVLHTAGVELDFFHRAAIIAFWAGAVLYFYWALGRRQFIYVWDYANYLIKQYNAEAAFALGPVAGFKYIISTFSEDYTNFITLFTEFPFCLTAKTGDSYAFAQVFCVLPSLMLMLAGLTIKIGQMLEVKNKFWYFLIGFSWVLTYPFLRMSAMLAKAGAGAVRAHLPGNGRDYPEPPLVLIFCGGLLFFLCASALCKQYKARKTGPKGPCPAPSTQPHPVWCLRHGSNGGPALAHGQ